MSKDMGDPAAPSGSSSFGSSPASAGLAAARSIPIATYESAVRGRREFREAYRAERNAVHGLSAAIATALKHLDGCRFMWNGPIHQAAGALRSAQGIEARRAETRSGSVEDESPVGAADAPEEPSLLAESPTPKGMRPTIPPPLPQGPSEMTEAMREWLRLADPMTGALPWLWPKGRANNSYVRKVHAGMQRRACRLGLVERAAGPSEYIDCYRLTASGRAALAERGEG